MKTHWLLVLIIIATFFISSPVLASLDKNLKLGDSGSDVKKLQELLNKDPNTQVSLSGPGSPGQETEFFGAKTVSALSKFQEKFGDVILEPLGLEKGTGILGQLTRAVLNELYGNETGGHVFNAITNFNPGNLIGVTIPAEPPPLQELTGVTYGGGKPFNINGSNGDNLPSVSVSSKVKISKISPENGGVNTSVTITGAGFSTSTTGNTVSVGGNRKTRVRSSDGKTLKVVVENPLGKSPLNVTDTLKDPDGNTVSVSGGVVNIYSPVHGGASLVPSDMSVSVGGYNLDLPVGIYVEDDSGKISNTKTFKLSL
ncbi:MAG: IPT/TIG domain-containing protein [Candidatus Vogelbacteria bacterium]|nr:IPT/TIG domain-containing protein [Candidatus Vogelbacteria bacterium]